jgi:hypothetical protein
MAGRILAGEAEDDLQVARTIQRQFTLAGVLEDWLSMGGTDTADHDPN